MAPKPEPLGKNLPRKGFVYDRRKLMFSDAKSSGKVVLAIQAAAHSTRIHPSAVDHRVAMLFSIAADMAHTIRSHGDNFWRVVMKQVAWTRDNRTMTPGIIKELTTYVWEAKLRCLAQGSNLPFSELNTTAIAVDRFMDNLKDAGMDRYIPVLEAGAEGAGQKDKPIELQQAEEAKTGNEDTTHQPTEIKQTAERTGASDAQLSFHKRKVTDTDSEDEVEEGDQADLPRAKKQQLYSGFLGTSYGEKENKTHFKGQQRIDEDLEKLADRFRAADLNRCRMLEHA